MRKMILALALSLSAAGAQKVAAQTAILTGIDNFSSGRLLPIVANQNVGGYIFIYKLHEKDTVQHLRIFDENLQKVGESSVSTGKKGLVGEVIYESGHLLLTTYEQMDRYGNYKETLKVLSLDSNATASFSPMPPEKQTVGFSKVITYPIGDYYSVPSMGFVGTYRNGGLTQDGATAVMTDPSGKLLWKKAVVVNADYGYSYPTLVGTTKSAIIYNVMTKKRMESRDARNYLVALDPATGATLFQKPLETGGESWNPLFVKPVSDDTAIICSQLSDADDKLLTARQTGFNYGLLNLKTGGITGLNTVHYATDLGREVEMVNETKSKDGFMHLQNVLRFPDGSAVVVGEFFRRTVNGAGMALGVAGAVFGVVPTNMTQGTTGDVFLMWISPQGKVTDISRIPMRPERVPIPVGTTISMLGRHLDRSGAFNYHHADDWDPEHKTVVLVGKDPESEKGYSTKVLHITSKGYKVKTLLSAAKMREEPTRISKAKPGHVLLMKQNAKTKAVSLELMRTD